MNDRSKKLLSLALGIAILAVLSYISGPKTFSQIQKVSLTALALSSAVYGVSWFFRADRLRYVLAESSPNFYKLFGINIGGYAGNIILPAKAGDLLRALYLSQNGVSKPESFVSVFYTRIQDLLAVIVILIIFIPSVLFIQVSSWLLLPVAVGAVFLILFIVLVFMGADSLEPYLRSVEKFIFNTIFGKDYNLTSSALQLLERYLEPAFTAHTLLRSVVIWLLEVFTAYIIAVSIVPGISIPLIFVAVSFGNVAKIIPATPGGFGLYEGAVASVLSISGVPYSAAFSIALIEHTLKNIFIVVIGSYFLSKEGLNLVQPQL